MKGKLRVGLLIILMLGVMGICTVKTYAVSSPYMSLNTTQDVITHDNAILLLSVFALNPLLTNSLF